MTTSWNDIFDAYGIKTVTKTDKGKSAYLPDKIQRHVLESAGIRPASTRPAPEFDITVLFDNTIDTIKASYYYAERLSSKRQPEPRMGHAFISSHWLSVGDRVLIGCIGAEVFSINLRRSALFNEDYILNEVLSRAKNRTIHSRALRAHGKPAKKTVSRDDFVRDPYVVAAAKLRAGNNCEMPSCNRALFQKDDSSWYLEVHHIVPLSEGGEDALMNVAALCPHCHREQHFGNNRSNLRLTLLSYIQSLPI